LNHRYHGHVHPPTTKSCRSGRRFRPRHGRRPHLRTRDQRRLASHPHRRSFRACTGADAWIRNDAPNITSGRSSSGQQLAEIRRPEPRRRIPARRGREAGPVDDLARRAADRGPDRDVIERGRLPVEERIEEAERRDALRRARRVQQRDDARERRRRGGRAADRRRRALVHDHEVDALGRDVRVRAPRLVEVLREPAAGRLGQVAGHGAGLVRRLREVVAEPAAGEAGDALGRHVLRRAHRRHVRARGREVRREDRPAARVVLADGARPGVAGGEHDADAARPQLHEVVAHRRRLREGPGLLVLAVGDAEGLRQLRVGQSQDAVEEVRVRLVPAGAGGFVRVGYQWAAAGGGELGHGDGVADADRVLVVQVCLDAGVRATLVVKPTRKLDHAEVFPGCVRRNGGLEDPQVGIARVLVEEGGVSELAVVRGRAVMHVIEAEQALWGDGLAADRVRRDNGVDVACGGGPFQVGADCFIAAHIVDVGAEAADAWELQSRRNEIDVRGDLRRYGVGGRSQASFASGTVLVPVEISGEQGVRLADRGGEGYVGAVD